MSISFFRLERDGRWGLSSSNSPTNHQKLNVTQKWAFHIFGWRGVVDEVQVHWPVWPTSDVECNTKMSISLFWLERGGGWGLSPLTSPANHQNLKCNPKSSISLFLAREGWQREFQSIDHLANHQKMNVIQKWAFHFFGWRGLADGV